MEGTTIRFRSRLLLLFLLALPASGFAEPVRWGIEAGLNRSTLDPRSPWTGRQVERRVLPEFGITAERPLSSRWALRPSIRYVQRGDRASYLYWDGSYRKEADREHTLSCGAGIDFRPISSVALSVSPELTYLVAGRIDGTYTYQLTPYDPVLTVRYHDEYASRSDRWNATIRAGIGFRSSLGAGSWLIQARYVRGINDLTRITPAILSSNQRNIAWYASTPPNEVTEWRAEGFELVAGIEW